MMSPASRPLVEPRIPETWEIEELLASELDSNGGYVLVTQRHANTYASTFPSELVACKIVSDHEGNEEQPLELRLITKYSGPADPTEHAHLSRSTRGLSALPRLEFEARVHTAVVDQSGLTAPRLVAAHHDRVSGGYWLFYEYIEGLRLDRSPWPRCMELGATWIGRFHARWASSIDDPALSFLPRFDERQYLTRIDRAFEALLPIRGQVEESAHWLLERRGGITEMILQAFRSSPPVVIHGEFYPANVLVADDAAWPVDWETAVIAAGELDLAMLTEDWDVESVDVAVGAYAAARGWAVDDALWVRVGSARLFMRICWLVDAIRRDRPSWNVAQRIEDSRDAAAKVMLG